MWNVVGLGVIVVDLLAVVERYPDVDTKQDIRDSRMQVGGPVPTALAQLNRFGRNCRFVGRWGDDPFGHFIKADLRAVGIEAGEACCQPGVVTGHSQVWIEAMSGTRTSVTQRPDEQAMALSAEEREAIRNATVVHLDGWPPALALEVADMARESSARLVVDTGSPKPGIEQLLRQAYLVNAPRRFIEEFVGETDLAAGALEIAKLGPSIVTVTDGQQGAVMVADGRVRRTTALNLDHVIDTNGAGDVFTAGLIEGLLGDWPAEQMLKFATASAGLMCRALGNRDALPPREQVTQAAAHVDVT